jgi:hypothetical protein
VHINKYKKAAQLLQSDGFFDYAFGKYHMESMLKISAHCSKVKFAEGDMIKPIAFQSGLNPH